MSALILTTADEEGRLAHGGDSVVHATERGQRAGGWEYIGISDHSQAAGMSEADVARQIEEIDAHNAASPEVRMLKGIEADISPTLGSTTRRKCWVDSTS